MDTLTVVEHDAFSTRILSPFNQSTLYSIASSRHPEGWWSSSIRRLEGSAPGHSCTELAKVSYLSWNATRVTFGSREIDLDAFLRRDSTYSNSRIFVGPDGQTYKWKIKGHSLELHDMHSHTLVARSHPRRLGLTMLLNSHRHPSLEVSRKHALADDPQMLDAIVVTYAVMQHKLQERLSYRYPS